MNLILSTILLLYSDSPKNVDFDRAKASGFNCFSEGCIYSILPSEKQLNRESFRVGQNSHFWASRSMFPILQESIPDGPFQYSGAHPREIIVVDPKDGPLLDAAYDKILTYLGADLSEEQIIKLVYLYVREVLFDLNLCNEREVKALIYSLRPNESEPEIPLETFLKYKTGLCRHIALTSTCLLNRLIKDDWLHGDAFLIRENCVMGRHAWTLFLSEKGAWHLDSLWGVLENGKTSAGFSRLCDNYGKRIMYEQKKRWETSP